MGISEIFGISVVLVVVATFVCLVVFFLTGSICGEVAEKISALSALSTLVVALGAGWVAWSQLQESKKSSEKQLHESRDSSAREIYKEYISLSIEHPEFSAQSCYGGKSGLQKIKRNKQEYEKYENYVAFLLFSAEQIEGLTSYNRTWERVLLSQITYHAVYLQSPDFQESMMSFYSDDLQDLIVRAISDFNIDGCGR